MTNKTMGNFWSKSPPHQETQPLLLAADPGIEVPPVGIHGDPEKMDFSGVSQVALAGGGVKGLAHLGALEVIERYHPGFVSQIKGWSGTSAGGILSSLLAVGWSLENLKNLIMVTDFTSFLDESLSFSVVEWLRDAVQLVSYEGLNSGNAFYEFMGIQIAQVTGSKDTTLGELWASRGVKLVLTTTDLNLRRAVHLSHETYPDLPIRLAVRMTMSIPFVFRPVAFKDMVLIDGGVLDNMPLHVFDATEPFHSTLGIMLETPDEWYVDQGEAPPSSSSPKSISSFGMAIVDVYQAAMRRENFGRDDQERLLVIPVPNFPLTKFSLTPKEKNDLLDAYPRSVFAELDKK